MMGGTEGNEALLALVLKEDEVSSWNHSPYNQELGHSLLYISTVAQSRCSGNTCSISGTESPTFLRTVFLFS